MQRNATSVPARWVFRAALLATTGLSALVLPVPACAQTDIPADTTPQGGSVAAGSAAITQAPGSTTINQSSARTVIDWQSFNVGSAASVQFNQPSASAIALNRVVTPSPSIIAGQINANGQLVLINQSGVVVTKGADINAQSIVLATSNIATKDFMFGNMAFSGAPNPGAKIINDGNITVRDTGLVGLVAPQVENDGVITARLGQVTLAGASAFTLDLYGDRLISLDVTKAVRAVDVGGNLVPALVTNRGLILADGGKITLTAQDADALVTQLIDTGGTIRADTVGGQTGTIAISGVGGDITIAGNLLARGTASGATGGGVQALTTGTVSVAPTALIDASGAVGGGLIALGTDLNRASVGAADRTAPRAAAVQVAAGAALRADATQAGEAGRVVLLSQNQTAFQGLISVQGGPHGGNGGVAEISSDGVVSLGGTVLDTAADGQSGEVLLDPATLAITAGATSDAASSSSGGVTTLGDDGASGVSTLAAASLDSLGGTIILDAASLISVGAALGLTAASALTLASLGDITIGAAISVASGGLEVDAADTLFVGGALSATDISLQDSGAGGITLAAPVDAGYSLMLQSGGAITEAAGGVINADVLSGAATGAAGLDASLNDIGIVNGFSAASFNLQDSSTAVFTAALTAGSITLVTPNELDIAAPIVATAGDVELVASGLGFANAGAVTAPGNAAIAYAPFTPTTIALTGSGDDLASFTAGTVVLGAADGHEATVVEAGGDDSFAGTLLLEAANEALQIGTLTASDLGVTAGSIIIAGQITTAGALNLSSSGTIVDAGALSADTISFGAAAFGQGSNGTITAGPITAGLLTGSAASSLTFGNLENAIGALGTITVGNGDVLIGNSVPLQISGPVRAQDITLRDIAPGGFSLGAGGSLLASGNIELTGDALTAAAGATLSASAVTLAPYLDLGIDLGGTNAGMLGLAQPVFTAVAGVPSLQIGVGAASIVTSGAIAAEAGTLLLDASAIAFDSAFSASGMLILQSPGDVTEDSLGAVTVPTLAGTGTLGNVALTSADNAVGALGAMTLASGDTLALGDAGLLTAAGPLSAAFVTLSAGTLAVTGDIAAPSQILLDGASGVSIANAIDTASLLLGSANGGVTESASALILATSLASFGVLGGGVSLAGGFNAINDLGAFSASRFVLTDSEALGVTGAFAAGNATLSAPGIAFKATVDVPGTLALISGSGITQTAAITAGTLTSGGATDQNGVDLDENPNSIATLGAFSLGSGNFALQDTAPLTLAGPFSAPAASLLGTSLGIGGALTTQGELTLAFTGGIGIAGPVNAGALDLANSLGTIAEAPGGTISTAILSDDGSASAGLDLGEVNAVSTLSNINDGGALRLTDAMPLTLAGTVSAANVALSAPSLDFTGTLLTTQTLQLASTAGSSEATGAVISAPTLNGSNTGGNVELVGANTIANLGSLAFGAGDFALDDRAALTLTGPLTGGTATLVAPGLFLASNLLVTNALTLSGVDALQVAGSIATGSLDLSLTGEADLASSGNTVTSLGGVAGDVTLNDARPLDVAGLTGADISLTAPAIDFTGDAQASGILTLDSPGAISQAGGTISAATLASAGLGTATFDQPGNAILNLGGVTASSFGLTDATPLAVTGPLLANTATLSAAGIALDGAVDIPGILSLGGAGGLTQGGALTTGTLTGTFGGDAVLSNASNSIATLGDFSVGGTLGLSDGIALNLAGDIAAAAADFTAPGIGLTGSLRVSGAAQLTSTAGITEAPAATLDAASLSGTNSGGNVELNGGNSIASLGDFSLSSGAFSLTDDAPLTVNGPLTGGAATLIASSLVLAGNITASDALTLGSAMGVQQNSGGMITPDLIIAATGGAALTGGSNSIGSLSANTGDFSLSDQIALGVSTLTASDAALTAPAINLGSGVDVPGLLALASPGAITQGAPFTAGTLGSNGATDGAAALSQPDNAIGTLGAFSASVLSLTDSIPLTIAGPVEASVLSLSGPALAFSGNVTAGTLALASAQGISQAGGGITAGTLAAISGDLSGNTVLDGANAISTLASVTDLGNFNLATETPLTLAGGIAASNLTLSSDGLAITGPVTANDLQIDGTGDVAETGDGAIIADALTTGAGSIGGGVALNAPGNSILHLSDFAATGGLSLNDSQALTLEGPIALGGTLTVADPDSVTQTTGTLDAGGFATGGAGIGGDLTLNQAGNAISSLGDLAVAGSASIADTVPLALTGVISIGGDSLGLGDTGPISQTGGKLTAGVLNASASALSLPEANDIGALGSIAVAGNLLVNGAASLTGPLTAENATLSAPGDFTLAGNASVTDNLLINAAGDVTQTSGAVAAQNFTISAASITLGGTDTAPGTLDLLAIGTITQSGGMLSGGTLAGTGGSLAAFGTLGGTADFAALGGFTLADSLFTLDNSGPLMLIGPVSASTVDITATGQLALDGTAGGGLNLSGGPAGPDATLPPSATQSELAVLPSPSGATSITETGDFAINPGLNGATIFLVRAPSATSAGGNITFNPAAGLSAPGADVILAAGTDGLVTGNINAGQLEIYSAAAVNLTGIVAGVSGDAAAAYVTSLPGPLPQYQFNGYEIGVVSYANLPITILQESTQTLTSTNPIPKIYTPLHIANPLENFDISQRKRRRLNKNVQLPGIATHDF